MIWVIYGQNGIDVNLLFKYSWYLLRDVIEAIYFALPIYVANMAPVLVKKWFNCLAVPVDFGKKLGDNYIFGKTKTYRGLVFAVIFSIFVVFFQKIFYVNFKSFRDWSLVDYSIHNPFILGFSLGFFAIVGDLIESFVKRRFGFRSGKAFFPWDQIDFVLGAMLVNFKLIKLKYWIILLLITPILHLTTNIVGYKLGLKNEPW